MPEEDRLGMGIFIWKKPSQVKLSDGISLDGDFHTFCVLTQVKPLAKCGVRDSLPECELFGKDS